MRTMNIDYGRYPRFLRELGQKNSDDVLRGVGLQTRRSTGEMVLSGAGMIGLGVALGVGLGMLFAPRRGSQLRREVQEKAREMKHRVAGYKAKAEQAAEKIQEQAPPPAH